MYSTIKSIQLLTALLKKYNINKLVLSPGGSDIPIIHSLEMTIFLSVIRSLTREVPCITASDLHSRQNPPLPVSVPRVRL